MESPELNKSVAFSNKHNTEFAHDGHKTSIEASNSQRIGESSLERPNRPALTDTRNGQQSTNVMATVSAFDSLKHQKSESKQNLILLEQDSSFTNLHYAPSSPALNQVDSKQLLPRPHHGIFTAEFGS